MIGIASEIYRQVVDNGSTMIKLYHVTQITYLIMKGGVADSASPKA
jgi:hypothetical protein